jgi:hypothetical protein
LAAASSADWLSSRPSRRPLPALPAIAMPSDRRGEPSAPGYSVHARPRGNRPCFLARQKVRQFAAVYRSRACPQKLRSLRVRVLRQVGAKVRADVP